MKYDRGVSMASAADMEAWSILKPVFEDFAARLAVNINVANPHGRYVEEEFRSNPPAEKGVLFVRFWASGNPPKDRVKWPTIRFASVFGVRLQAGGQGDGTDPSGKGEAIRDDTGQVVAEVVDGTLYVLFDLPHSREMHTANIMRRILETYEKTHQAYVEDLIEDEAERRAVNRPRFIGECGARILQEKNETEANLREAEASLHGTTQTIVDLEKRLLDLRRQELLLLEGEKQRDVRFGEEFDTLSRMPHVKKVLVQNGTVFVFTDTVFIEFDEQRWEIGDFKIGIDAEGGLSIYNLRAHELTGQTNMHHPHVFDGGTNPCLGNIGVGLREMLDRHEYAVVAQVVIEFLHSLTHGSQYIGSLRRYWRPSPLGRLAAA